MAYREDYLTPETLAKADELDIYFSSRGPVDYPAPSSDAPQTYSLAIDDPLPPPKFLSLEQMMSHNKDPMPKQVIEGVLHKGSKMIISGSSKAGKTLSLLHLGLAAANGSTWLGHRTATSKVIYLDFELKKRIAARRIAEMVNANSHYDPKNPNFLYCSLRGQSRTLEDLVHHIEDLENHQPDLVIVDPFYKLATGADENDAGAISEVVNRMEKFSERLDCSFVYATTSPKETSLTRTTSIGQAGQVCLPVTPMPSLPLHPTKKRITSYSRPPSETSQPPTPR